VDVKTIKKNKSVKTRAKKQESRNKIKEKYMHGCMTAWMHERNHKLQAPNYKQAPKSKSQIPNMRFFRL
jgi:hypothetical protein